MNRIKEVLEEKGI